MTTTLPTPEPPFTVKLSDIFLWIAATCLAVNIGQQLLDALSLHTLPAYAVWASLAVLGLVAMLQVALNWRTYIKIVPTINFGIAVVAAAAIAVTAGTLVVQTGNQTVFYARYGFAAPMMTWLYLNDLFHAAWFEFLLALLAVALADVAFRRKTWTWRQIGFLLSHCGIILVLVGGAIGQFYGRRGVINLQTGESAGKYDEGNGKTVSLPFNLKLDRFVVERRQPEFRLYLIERHNEESKVLASFNAAKPGVYTVGGFGKIEVLSFTPGKPDGSENSAKSNSMSGSSEPRPEDGAPAGDPVVKLRLHQDGVPSSEIELRSGGPSSTSLGSEERELRLAKKSDDVANFVSTLAIEKNGKQLLSQSVRVNQPLNYDGYSFYQASYDPKNPRYSGILVVKDPGLTLVYLGLVIVFAGIAHILLIRPRRARREETAA